MSDTLHVVCPHCHAVNRLTRTKLGQSPKCGHCHAAVFASQAVELNGAAFDKHLTRSEIPLLVDFWAPWCGPCKMMAPHFTQAAAILEPQLRLAKVNTEIEQDLGAKYNIRSIPTLVLFRNSREIARQAGALGTQDIVNWVSAHL